MIIEGATFGYVVERIVRNNNVGVVYNFGHEVEHIGYRFVGVLSAQIVETPINLTKRPESRAELPG